MNEADRIASVDAINASMEANAGAVDVVQTSGQFQIECHDGSGRQLWRGEFPNRLTTLGKNALLDLALAGSAYTAADYIGLISSASFSTIVAADTMSSHAGWLEAGATNSPHYSGTRALLAWSAASAGTKSSSAPGSFVFTNSGTVQGGFVVIGTGAVSTIDNTGGILYAAGTLAAAQPVISGNTVTLGYGSTLT